MIVVQFYFWNVSIVQADADSVIAAIIFKIGDRQIDVGGNIDNMWKVQKLREMGAVKV